MPYITVFQTIRTHQITLDEILAGEVRVLPQPRNSRVNGTVTRFSSTVSPKLMLQYNVMALIRKLKEFNDKYTALFEVDRQTLYHSFAIPKKSGGVRRIDAPNDSLMEALRELASMLQNDFCALYHTSAFAYVKGRSAIDAVKKHQKHQSRWFLKIDFENFFGNTTFEFMMRMLEMIFPFSEVIRVDQGRVELERALSLCFLNGGLPQGTPISPMLTNLVMIPIDYQITKSLNKDGFVFTRYADDSIISHKYNFKFTDVCARIQEILKDFNAPYAIKQSKTRYGSSSGANWNLGVMLNRDNEITIGIKRRKMFKVLLNNYLTDRQNGIKWPPEDIQCMQGTVSYYRMVEPETIDKYIALYNQKFNTDFMLAMREDLG